MNEVKFIPNNQLDPFFLISCSDKEETFDEQGEDEDFETAQDKRLRLAKQYLAQLESEGKY